MKIYIGGDGLKKGNQIMRNSERDAFKQAGFEVFNPWDCKDINDKSNAPTSEAIFDKDTEAMLKSNVIIFDADNDSVGTSVEIGQMWGISLMHELIKQSLKMCNKMTLQEFADIIFASIPEKKVRWHTTDVRNTNIPEQGMRRSFSMNAYLHGCLCSFEGQDKPMAIEDIMKEVKNMK